MEAQWIRQGIYEVCLADHEVGQLDRLSIASGKTPAETIVDVTERGIIELLAQVVEGDLRDKADKDVKVICPQCNAGNVSKTTQQASDGSGEYNEYTCLGCNHEWDDDVSPQIHCPDCDEVTTIDLHGKAAANLGIADGLYCSECFLDGNMVRISKIPDNLDGDTEKAGKETTEDVEHEDDKASDLEDQQTKEADNVTAGSEQLQESPDE